MKTVCMLGGGAWGTAVATLLAEKGYRVKLWCHDKEECEVIQTARVNERYLPGIVLDEKIQPILDLKYALQDVRWVFEATPVKFLRSVLEQAKPWYVSKQIWVVLSKGIEKDTLLLPSQVIDDCFDVVVNKVVLGGPSFAHDLARKQITAVTVASTDHSIGVELQNMLASNYFRPYISHDIIGVQVGGAIKNVIALGIGMLDGAGFTDNTKAFLFTCGLHEMMKLSQKMGGKQETLCGLSGVGDMVLTSMGSLSRNLAIGKRFGRGETLDTILCETGCVPEGVNTVESVYQLMHRLNLSLPICEGIYHVIFSGKKINDVMVNLMNKPLLGQESF